MGEKLSRREAWLVTLTSGWRRAFFVLLPVVHSAVILFGYRGAGRYDPPGFGGPEPSANHFAALEILATGTTTMTFHATGYSYFIAAVYAVLPRLPVSVLAVQALLLPLMVLAVSRIARAFGGDLAARTALLVAAVYYPFGYYAATYSTIVPAFLAVTGTVAVALPLVDAPNLRRSLLTGLLLGLAVCFRPNMAFVGVVLFAAFWVSTRSLAASLVRTVPIGAVSLALLGTMTVANPPEPGQFARGSQAMNRGLLEGTYQFQDRWWDWEALNDPQQIAKFWAHARQLELESGKPLEAPETQLLAKRDFLRRVREMPLNSIKKAAISAVRIWIFMPSHSHSMRVKVGIAASETLLLLVALYGIAVTRRERGPWMLGVGVMLMMMLPHLLITVEARYSLPGRGVEVAFIGVGLAALLFRRGSSSGQQQPAPAAPQ